MDLLKNLLLYKNDRFNIWNANMEGREAMAVSLIGNTKTQLKCLPAFHVVISRDTIFPELYQLHLLAYNGKLLQTEGAKGLNALGSSNLLKIIEDPKLELCSGIKGDFQSECVNEHMGNSIVKRSKNCEYLSLNGTCPKCFSGNNNNEDFTLSYIPTA